MFNEVLILYVVNLEILFGPERWPKTELLSDNRLGEYFYNVII